MLIVANQAAAGVSRETRLACTGKAKEERHIATGSDVGRAVHGQHPLGRQYKVEHGKNRLFHFASVLCAGDQDEPLFKVDNDSHLGACTKRARVSMKIRDTEDGETGMRAGQIVLVSTQEDLSSKKIMPGHLSNYLIGHTVTNTTGARAIHPLP